MAQMAGLLKPLQDYPLPNSIQGFGVVTYDDNGAIVSGLMTTVGARPWDNFEDSYRGRLEVTLTIADTGLYLQGWRVNSARLRIDALSSMACQHCSLTCQPSTIPGH